MNVADLTKMDYFFSTVIYSYTRTHCIRMYLCTRRHTQLSRLLTNFDLNTALPEQQNTRSYQFSERKARRRRRKKQLWNMCIWRIETHLCLCWSFFCFTFSYDFLFSLWVGIRCVQWMYNWQPWPVFASNESNWTVFFPHFWLCLLLCFWDADIKLCSHNVWSLWLSLVHVFFCLLLPLTLAFGDSIVWTVKRKKLS